MKDWMAIHTFLSEDAKAQHLSAKGKVRTEKEWAEYSMSLEKAKCVQEWCGHEEFFFCHWQAETPRWSPEDDPKLRVNVSYKIVLICFSISGIASLEM